MLKKSLFIMILIYSYALQAFELPSVSTGSTSKAEIVFFNADSVLVDEKLSYVLRWKTANAKDVKLTFIGKVENNGEITITQEEFNQGAITLSASSFKSDYVDKVVINQNEEVFDEANPVPANTTNETPQFYDTIPRHYYGRPYRRYPAGHPGAIRRRY